MFVSTRSFSHSSLEWYQLLGILGSTWIVDRAWEPCLLNDCEQILFSMASAFFHIHSSSSGPSRHQPPSIVPWKTVFCKMSCQVMSKNQTRLSCLIWFKDKVHIPVNVVFRYLLSYLFIILWTFQYHSTAGQWFGVQWRLAVWFTCCWMCNSATCPSSSCKAKDNFSFSAAWLKRSFSKYRLLYGLLAYIIFFILVYYDA